jgi:hypothetical protein
MKKILKTGKCKGLTKGECSFATGLVRFVDGSIDVKNRGVKKYVAKYRGRK